MSDCADCGHDFTRHVLVPYGNDTGGCLDCECVVFAAPSEEPTREAAIEPTAPGPCPECGRGSEEFHRMTCSLRTHPLLGVRETRERRAPAIDVDLSAAAQAEIDRDPIRHFVEHRKRVTRIAQLESELRASQARLAALECERPPLDGFGSHKADLAELRIVQAMLAAAESRLAALREQIEALPAHEHDADGDELADPLIGLYAVLSLLSSDHQTP